MSLYDTVARINPEAVRIADAMEADAAALGIEVDRLGNGCRLIDAGVKAAGRSPPGGCTPRPASAAWDGSKSAPAPWSRGPSRGARRDRRPVVACLGSQYAGWKVQAGKFFAWAPVRRARCAPPSAVLALAAAGRAPTPRSFCWKPTAPGPEVAESWRPHAACRHAP